MKRWRVTLTCSTMRQANYNNTAGTDILIMYMQLSIKWQYGSKNICFALKSKILIVRLNLLKFISSKLWWSIAARAMNIFCDKGRLYTRTP